MATVRGGFIWGLGGSGGTAKIDASSVVELEKYIFPEAVLRAGGVYYDDVQGKLFDGQSLDLVDFWVESIRKSGDKILLQVKGSGTDEDYIDEKWSQKYKSSINCASPKGFSQRAHCAGRKK